MTLCNRPITLSHMWTIKPLPTFTAWLNRLADPKIRGTVIARIKRLEMGLMGDVSSVGDGIHELRIHLGAGWQVYFTRRAGQVIVLLAGGPKRTQKADIRRAKDIAARLED